MNSNINWTSGKLIALIFVCSLCGALGGYFAASFSPVQSQLAIVDVQAVIKRAVEKNQAKTAEDAQALTAKIKASTDGLVKQGIVIIDAQSIVSAPDEAYVTIE